MNKAITDGLVLMPPPFANGLTVWSAGDGTPGSETYATTGNGVYVPADQDFAGCLELLKTQSVTKLRYMGETTLLPGCYLRISTRVKAVSGELPGVRIADWAGGAGGAHVAGLTEYGPTTQLTSYGDVIDDIVSIDTLLDGGRIDVDILQLVLMRQAKGFAKLPTEALIRIYERMIPVTVEAGEEVIRQDMKGDKFYFLRQGCAEVWREELEDDEPRHVATLGTGVCFGEEALILGGARNATVRMITPGELLTLDGESYTELVAKPSVSRISIDEAKQKIARGAHLVDVRYQDEWDEGHLPGAVHIPLSALRDRVREVTPEREVVVYCRSGRRSQVGAFLMAQNGYTAFSMDGGINGWTDEIVKPV